MQILKGILAYHIAFGEFVLGMLHYSLLLWKSIADGKSQLTKIFSL